MITDSLPLASVLPPAALSCIAVLALVLCDFREIRAGRYIFKPLAAAAFVWLAVSLDATSTAYGNWLLAALIFCMVGDLLLMPDERTQLSGWPDGLSLRSPAVRSGLFATASESRGPRHKQPARTGVVGCGMALADTPRQ